METNNVEVKQLESAVKEAADSQLRELIDMQLALVGGGGGEVAFV